MFDRGTSVSVSENCGAVLVRGEDGAEWMRIDSEGRSVKLALFPRNIPKSCVGEAARSVPELKYNILCESTEAAPECKLFLAKLISSGYGEDSARSSAAWCIALDIENLTEAFSENMRYSSLPLGGDITAEASEFFERNGLGEAKRAFVCTVAPMGEELALDEYHSKVIEAFDSSASEDCVVFQQLILDKSITSATLHVLFGGF